MSQNLRKICVPINCLCLSDETLKAFRPFYFDVYVLEPTEQAMVLFFKPIYDNMVNCLAGGKYITICYLGKPLALSLGLFGNTSLHDLVLVSSVHRHPRTQPI